MNRWIISVTLGTMLAGTPSAKSYAQSAEQNVARPTTWADARTLSVTAGFMPWMDPDLNVQPAQWSATANFRVSRHWSVEPELASWSYTEDLRLSGAPIGSTRHRAWWTVGANMVCRIPAGRFSIYTGIGGAWARLESRVTWAGGPTNEWSATGGALTFLAGTDIWLTPRIAATVALRARVVPAADLGVAGPSVGIRVGF